jgi:hypothetical protein
MLSGIDTLVLRVVGLKLNLEGIKRCRFCKKC